MNGQIRIPLTNRPAWPGHSGGNPARGTIFSVIPRYPPKKKKEKEFIKKYHAN